MIVFLSQRELDQTNLFEIVVQTVSLGVHRDPFSRADALDQRFHRSAFANVNVTLGLRRIQRLDLFHWVQAP